MPAAHDSRLFAADSTLSTFPARAAPPVPGFALLGRVGRGGFATVFRARHRRTGRVVALKIAHPAAAADPDARAAFAREAEHLAAARHPNVVRCFGTGTAGRRPFLALELCAGDLSDRLRVGRLGPRAAAALVAAVARGAGAAHAAGVLHLDVKPANILVTADGTPKLADLGLARPAGADLSTDDGVCGTPAYLSPEQATGNAAAYRPATDVWGLGTVLYECLTGRRPYEGETTLATVLAVARATQVAAVRAHAPDVPAELEAICLRCLRKDPAARFADGNELADALDAIAPGTAGILPAASRAF